MKLPKNAPEYCCFIQFYFIFSSPIIKYNIFFSAVATSIEYIEPWAQSECGGCAYCFVHSITPIRIGSQLLDEKKRRGNNNNKNDREFIRAPRRQLWPKSNLLAKHFICLRYWGSSRWAFSSIWHYRLLAVVAIQHAPVRRLSAFSWSLYFLSIIFVFCFSFSFCQCILGEGSIVFSTL